MKIAALDVGDVWTGIAISDALAMFARPLKTIKAKELHTFLQELITTEPVKTIVIGYPKTMRNTSSDQTKKVEALKQQLEADFPTITWVLWDERLSSKQAQSIKAAKTKEEKLHSHAIAAAVILNSYLEFNRFSKQIDY